MILNRFHTFKRVVSISITCYREWSIIRVRHYAWKFNIGQTLDWYGVNINNMGSPVFCGISLSCGELLAGGTIDAATARYVSRLLAAIMVVFLNANYTSFILHVLQSWNGLQSRLKYPLIVP